MLSLPSGDVQAQMSKFEIHIEFMILVRRIIEASRIKENGSSQTSTTTAITTVAVELYVRMYISNNAVTLSVVVGGREECKETRKEKYSGFVVVDLSTILPGIHHCCCCYCCSTI